MVSHHQIISGSAFKFPKTITHQQHLQHVAQASTEFLQRLSPLGERINGLMVQLPAGFFAIRIGAGTERFLKQLPSDYQYAVEVRHPAFFTDTVARNALNTLLQELGVDRIIFDSRPVHAAPIVDEATEKHKFVNRVYRCNWTLPQHSAYPYCTTSVIRLWRIINRG